MDIHQYARSLETVGRYLGCHGWVIVQPMLEARMKKESIIALNFKMHDGVFYYIRLENNNGL